MKVQDKVVEIIADTCEVDAPLIKLESRLDNGLKMDELRFVELLIALEEGFDMKIPECDFDHFETVADITGYIERIKG